MLNFLIAHAGEVHESTVESSAHSIPWYFQILLFLMFIGCLSVVLYFTVKRIDRILLIISSVLFIAGIFFYQIAPAVSVIAITSGLVITLLVTLLGLGSK